jgi:hypothetical protein
MNFCISCADACYSNVMVTAVCITRTRGIVAVSPTMLLQSANALMRIMSISLPVSFTRCGSDWPFVLQRSSRKWLFKFGDVVKCLIE